MVKMYAHYMWIKIIIIIRIRSVVHTHSRKFTQHFYAKIICPRSHLLLLFSVLLLTSSEVRLKRSFRFRKMAVNVWEVGQKKESAGKFHFACKQINLNFRFISLFLAISYSFASSPCYSHRFSAIQPPCSGKTHSTLNFYFPFTVHFGDFSVNLLFTFSAPSKKFLCIANFLAHITYIFHIFPCFTCFASRSMCLFNVIAHTLILREKCWICICR